LTAASVLEIDVMVEFDRHDVDVANSFNEVMTPGAQIGKICQRPDSSLTSVGTFEAKAECGAAVVSHGNREARDRGRKADPTSFAISVD
jgi:hypothetical protein